MIPYLFTPEAEPEILLEAADHILEDVNRVELWAAGDPNRAFDTLGLGALSDAITCEVTEERNGEYELAMEYPISGTLFEQIELRCIVLAKPNYSDDPQAFRIYTITTPIDGKVTIFARHISYDLSGVPVLPFTATSCAAACQGLIDNAAIDTPFTVGTQIGTIADFKADVPASVRSWFGGKEGSLIDVYGGEWWYDNYSCVLKANRGANRGVTIRYGVNLIDFEQEKNCEETYTGVLPYWVDEEGNQVRANIINLVGTFEYRRILVLDLSLDFEEQPTVQQLTDKANSYIAANNIGVPKVSITLDWVQIGELEDRVELCDTVKVVFEKIGVETSAKIVRVVWDVLKERYSTLEIGEPKTNITDTIAGLEQETERATSSVSTVMLGAIQRATQAITGNSGGYTVMYDSDGDGEPDEFLILNTPDISTATKVWRWNLSGLGYSNSGYNGTFGLAMTMNGEIVADYITTGTLDASRATITNLNASNITSGTLSANYISGGTINGTNVSITNLNASNISSGTLSANYIKGGTLTLGGASNGYGILKVLNASNAERVNISNMGLKSYDVSSNYYSILDGLFLNFYNSSGSGFGGLSANTSDQVTLQSTGSLTLTSTGGNVNISVGTNGYLTLTNVYNKTNSGAPNLFLYSGGYVYRSTSSSRKYKTGITEDLADLDPEVLYDLPVVRFKFKDGYINEDDERYGKDVIGFIAEDVDRLYPIAVQHEDGQAEMWASNYMIPAMMELIKRQKAKIDELEERLDRLEARLLDDGR